MFDITITGKIVLFVALPTTFVLLYLLLRRTDVRQRILRRWKLTTDKSVSSGQELTTDDEEEDTTSKSRSSRQSVIELKVPTYAVSAVIGQEGTTIKKIEKNSRAKIEIKENEDTSEEETTLLIKGHTKAVQKAELTIRSIIADVPTIISEDIYVPNSCTRFLLGKQAETLQKIRRVSGAKIVLDRVKINDPTYMRLVSLTGTREQNELAKKLINEKIDEFETFQTTSDSVRLQESQIPLAEEALETTQMPPVREKWEIESEQGLTPLGNQRRDVLEVMVVAAENPGHFWGHICNENLTKLIQLQNELEAFYGKSEELEACRISEAAKNDIVAVCLDNGTKWFRARITEVLDDGYQVFCVDYGYREVVSKCDIRKLCGSFLSLPFQALECYLANIKPTDNENWSKSATEMFENMVCINQSKVISGDIINYQRTSHGLVPCLNLIDYNGPQVSWCNLWLRASPKHVPAKGTVNINEELVQMGHAEWDEASESGRIFKDDLSADVSHKVLTREGSGSIESLNDPFLKFPLEEKHKIPSPPANAEWADDFPYAWAYNKEESTARGDVCEIETCLSDKYSPTREITQTGAGGINSLQETHTLPKETTESSYSMTGYDEENRAPKTDDTKDLSGSLFYNGICSDVDRGLPASSDHPPICHPDGYSVRVPTAEDSTLCPFSTEDTYIDRREEILTSADDDTLFTSSQIDSKMSQVQDIDRLADQQGRTLSNTSLDRSDTINLASEQEDSREFCSSSAVLAEPKVSTSKPTNISREDSSSAIVTLQDDHMTKLTSVEVPGREELALEESEYSVSISHDTSTSVQNREDDENELNGRVGLHSKLGTKGDKDEGKGDAVVSRRDPNVLTDINANRSVENLEHEQALWCASLSHAGEHEQLLNKNMKASERSTNQLLPEAEATASGNAQISTTTDLGISVTPINVQSTRNQSEVNDRCVLGATDDDSKTSDLMTDKIKIANELQTQTVSEISETESHKIDELSEITDTESCEKLKESGFLSVVPGPCLDETSSTLDYSQTEPLDILIPSMYSDISPAPCPTILDPTHTFPLPSVTTLDQPTLNVELTSSANLITEMCADLQEINVHTQVAESEINVILPHVEEVLSSSSQRELSPEVFGWAVVTRTASESKETDSSRYQHVQSLPSIDKTLKDKWAMLYSPLEEDDDWKVRTELPIGQKTQCPVSKTQTSSESSETVSEPLEKDTHTDDIWKFYHTPVSDKERYSEDVEMMSEEAEYSKNGYDAYKCWQTPLNKSLSKDQNVFHEDWKHTLSEPLEDDETDFYICSLSEYMTSERKDNLPFIEEQTEEKAGLPTMIYSSEKNIQVIESIKYVEEDGRGKEQIPVYSTNSTNGELHHDVTDLTAEIPKAEDSEKHVSTERPFWPKESNIVPMSVTEEKEKSDLEYSVLEDDEWEEGDRTEKTLTEKSQDVKIFQQDWQKTTSDPLEEETSDWLSFHSPVCEDSETIDTESIPDMGVKQDPSHYSGMEEDEWQEGERPQIKYDKEMSSVKTFQKEWKETTSDSLEEETDLLETSARTLVEPPTAPTTIECEKQPTDIEYATLEEDEWEEGEKRKINKDSKKPVEEKTFQKDWKNTESDPLEEETGDWLSFYSLVCEDSEEIDTESVPDMQQKQDPSHYSGMEEDEWQEGERPQIKYDKEMSSVKTFQKEWKETTSDSLEEETDLLETSARALVEPPTAPMTIECEKQPTDIEYATLEEDEWEEGEKRKFKKDGEKPVEEKTFQKDWKDTESDPLEEETGDWLSFYLPVCEDSEEIDTESVPDMGVKQDPSQYSGMEEDEWQEGERPQIKYDKEMTSVKTFQKEWKYTTSDSLEEETDLIESSARTLLEPTHEPVTIGCEDEEKDMEYSTLEEDEWQEGGRREILKSGEKTFEGKTFQGNWKETKSDSLEGGEGDWLSFYSPVSEESDVPMLSAVLDSTLMEDLCFEHFDYDDDGDWKEREETARKYESQKIPPMETFQQNWKETISDSLDEETLQTSVACDKQSEVTFAKHLEDKHLIVTPGHKSEILDSSSEGECPPYISEDGKNLDNSRDLINISRQDGETSTEEFPYIHYERTSSIEDSMSESNGSLEEQEYEDTDEMLSDSERLSSEDDGPPVTEETNLTMVNTQTEAGYSSSKSDYMSEESEEEEYEDEDNFTASDSQSSGEADFETGLIESVEEQYVSEASDQENTVPSCHTSELSLNEETPGQKIELHVAEAETILSDKSGQSDEDRSLSEIEDERGGTEILDTEKGVCKDMKPPSDVVPKKESESSSSSLPESEPSRISENEIELSEKIQHEVKDKEILEDQIIPGSSELGISQEETQEDDDDNYQVPAETVRETQLVSPAGSWAKMEQSAGLDNTQSDTGLLDGSENVAQFGELQTTDLSQVTSEDSSEKMDIQQEESSIKVDSEKSKDEFPPEEGMTKFRQEMPKALLEKTFREGWKETSSDPLEEETNWLAFYSPDTEEVDLAENDSESNDPQDDWSVYPTQYEDEILENNSDKEDTEFVDAVEEQTEFWYLASSTFSLDSYDEKQDKSNNLKETDEDFGVYAADEDENGSIGQKYPVDSELKTCMDWKETESDPLEEGSEYSWIGQKGDMVTDLKEKCYEHPSNYSSLYEDTDWEEKSLSKNPQPISKEAQTKTFDLNWKETVSDPLDEDENLPLSLLQPEENELGKQEQQEDTLKSDEQVIGSNLRKDTLLIEESQREITLNGRSDEHSVSEENKAESKKEKIRTEVGTDIITDYEKSAQEAEEKQTEDIRDLYVAEKHIQVVEDFTYEQSMDKKSNFTLQPFTLEEDEWEEKEESIVKAATYGGVPVKLFGDDWRQTESDPIEMECHLSSFLSADREDEDAIDTESLPDPGGKEELVEYYGLEDDEWQEGERPQMKYDKEMSSVKTFQKEWKETTSDSLEEETDLLETSARTLVEPPTAPTTIECEKQPTDIEYATLEEDEWEEGEKRKFMKDGEKPVEEKTFQKDWKDTESDPLEEETGDWLSFYSPVCEDSEEIDTESVPDMGQKQDPTQYSGMEEDEWQEGERPQIKYDKEMKKTLQKEWKETTSDSLEEETDLLETSARTLVEPPTAPMTIECEKQPTDIEYATLEEDEWEEGEKRKFMKDGEKPVEEKTFQKDWKDTESDPLEEETGDWLSFYSPVCEDSEEIDTESVPDMGQKQDPSQYSGLEEDEWQEGERPQIKYDKEMSSVKTFQKEWKETTSDSLEEETDLLEISARTLVEPPTAPMTIECEKQPTDIEYATLEEDEWEEGEKRKFMKDGEKPVEEKTFQKDWKDTESDPLEEETGDWLSVYPPVCEDSEEIDTESVPDMGQKQDPSQYSGLEEDEWQEGERPQIKYDKEMSSVKTFQKEWKETTSDSLEEETDLLEISARTLVEPPTAPTTIECEKQPTDIEYATLEEDEWEQGEKSKLKKDGEKPVEGKTFQKDWKDTESDPLEEETGDWLSFYSPVCEDSEEIDTESVPDMGVKQDPSQYSSMEEDEWQEGERPKVPYSNEVVSRDSSEKDWKETVSDSLEEGEGDWLSFYSPNVDDKDLVASELTEDTIRAENFSVLPNSQTEKHFKSEEREKDIFTIKEDERDKVVDTAEEEDWLSYYSAYSTDVEDIEMVDAQSQLDVTEKHEAREELADQELDIKQTQEMSFTEVKELPQEIKNEAELSLIERLGESNIVPMSVTEEKEKSDLEYSVLEDDEWEEGDRTEKTLTEKSQDVKMFQDWRQTTSDPLEEETSDWLSFHSPVCEDSETIDTESIPDMGVKQDPSHYSGLEEDEWQEGERPQIKYDKEIKKTFQKEWKETTSDSFEEETDLLETSARTLVEPPTAPTTIECEKQPTDIEYATLEEDEWEEGEKRKLKKDGEKPVEEKTFQKDWKNTESDPLEEEAGDWLSFYSPVCEDSEEIDTESVPDMGQKQDPSQYSGLEEDEWQEGERPQIKYDKEMSSVKTFQKEWKETTSDSLEEETDLLETSARALVESPTAPTTIECEKQPTDIEYATLEEDEWEEGEKRKFKKDGEKPVEEKTFQKDWKDTESDPLEEETGDWLSFYSPVCEDSEEIDTESVPDMGQKQDPSHYSGMEEDEWQEGERPQIKYDKEIKKTFQKEWKETTSDSLEEETDLLEISTRTLVEPPTAPTTIECEKQPTDIEYATLEEDEWEEGEKRKIKKDGEKPVEEKTFQKDWKDTESDPLEENDSCVPSLQEDVEIQLNGLNSTLSTVTVSEPLEHDLWTSSGHQHSVSDSAKTLAKTTFSDSLDEETNDVWPLVTSCYSDQDDNFDDVLDEEKSLVSKAVNTDDKDVWGMYFTSLDEANDEWNGYNEESCSRNASKTCKDVDRLEDFSWEIREQIAQSLPQQSKTASYQSQPKFFSNSLESWVSSGTGTLVTATPGDMSTPVLSDEDDDDNEYIDAEDSFQEVRHSSDPYDVSAKQNLLNGSTLQEGVTANFDHEALVRRQFIEEEISLLLSEIVAMATEESKCMEKRKLSEQDLKAESSKISQQITELIHGMVTSNEGVEKSNEEYNADQISNVSTRDINELATFAEIVPREVTFSDELQLTEHESDLKSCSLHVTQRMEEKLQNIATLYSNYAEEIPDTQLMLKLDTLYFIEKLGRDKPKPSPPENLPSLEATLSAGTDMAGPSTEAAASSESVDSRSRSSVPEISQDTNEQLLDLSQVETTSKSPVSENDEIFANVLMVELPSAEELSVSGQISSFDASIHDCETRRFTSVLEVSLPEGPTNENRELTPSKIVPESKKMKLKKKRLSPGDRIVRRWRKKSPYRNYSNALFVNIPSFEESSNVEFWKKMSRTCVEPNSDLEDFQKDKKMVQRRISEAGFPIETQSELLLRIPPNDSNSSWKSKFRCSLHTFVSDYDQKHFHNVFVIPKQHEKYSTEINMDINRRILADSAEEKLENSEELSESSAELACTPDVPTCGLSTSCISRNETVADSKPLIQEKTTIILQDQLKMNEKQPERKNSVVIDFATSDGSNEKMSYFTEDQIQSLLQKITQEASVSHYSKTAIFNDPYHFEDNYRYGVNGSHLGLMDPSGEIYYDAKSEPDKTMLSTYSEMLLSSNIISPETVEKVNEADFQVQAGSTDSEGYMTTEEKSESELQMTQTSERLAMDLSSLLSVDSAELSSELSKSYACDRPNSPEDQSISTSSSDSEGDYPASRHLILEFGSEKESRKSQASDQNDEPEIETVISEPSLTELEPRPETSFELSSSSAEPASTERKSTEQPTEVLLLEADSSKKSAETPSIQTEIVDESQELKLCKESVSQEKTIMEVNLFGEKHMVSSTDELKILVESHDLNIDDFSNIKLSPNSQLDCFSELSFGGASSVDLDELLHQKNLLSEVCATNESSSNQKDKQKELVSSCVDRKEEFSFIDLPKQIEKSVSEYCLQSRKSLTNGTCLPLPDGFPFGIGKPNIDDNEQQEAKDEERSVKSEMVKTEPCFDLPVADDSKDKTEIPKTEDTTLAGIVSDDMPESRDNMKIETEISPSVKDEEESDGALFEALDKGKKKKKKKSKFFALDNEVLMSFRDAAEVIRNEEEDTQVDDKAQTSSEKVETSSRDYDINFKSKESVAEPKHILSKDNKQKPDSPLYHSAMKESEISEIMTLDIPESNILKANSILIDPKEMEKTEAQPGKNSLVDQTEISISDQEDLKESELESTQEIAEMKIKEVSALDEPEIEPYKNSQVDQTEVALFDEDLTITPELESVQEKAKMKIKEVSVLDEPEIEPCKNSQVDQTEVILFDQNLTITPELESAQEKAEMKIKEVSVLDEPEIEPCKNSQVDQTEVILFDQDLTITPELESAQEKAEMKIKETSALDEPEIEPCKSSQVDQTEVILFDQNLTITPELESAQEKAKMKIKETSALDKPEIEPCKNSQVDQTEVALFDEDFTITPELESAQEKAEMKIKETSALDEPEIEPCKNSQVDQTEVALFDEDFTITPELESAQEKAEMKIKETSALDEPEIEPCKNSQVDQTEVALFDEDLTITPELELAQEKAEMKIKETSALDEPEIEPCKNSQVDQTEVILFDQDLTITPELESAQEKAEMKIKETSALDEPEIEPCKHSQVDQTEVALFDEDLTITPELESAQEKAEMKIKETSALAELEIEPCKNSQVDQTEVALFDQGLTITTELELAQERAEININKGSALVEPEIEPCRETQVDQSEFSLFDQDLIITSQIESAQDKAEINININKGSPFGEPEIEPCRSSQVDQIEVSPFDQDVIITPELESSEERAEMNINTGSAFDEPDVEPCKSSQVDQIEVSLFDQDVIVTPELESAQERAEVNITEGASLVEPKIEPSRNFQVDQIEVSTFDQAFLVTSEFESAEQKRAEVNIYPGSVLAVSEVEPCENCQVSPIEVSLYDQALLMTSKLESAEEETVEVNMNEGPVLSQIEAQTFQKSLVDETEVADQNLFITYEFESPQEESLECKAEKQVLCEIENQVTAPVILSSNNLPSDIESNEGLALLSTQNQESQKMHVTQTRIQSMKSCSWDSRHLPSDNVVKVESVYSQDDHMLFEQQTKAPQSEPIPLSSAAESHQKKLTNQNELEKTVSNTTDTDQKTELSSSDQHALLQKTDHVSALATFQPAFAGAAEKVTDEKLKRKKKKKKKSPFLYGNSEESIRSPHFREYVISDSDNEAGNKQNSIERDIDSQLQTTPEHAEVCLSETSKTAEVMTTDKNMTDVTTVDKDVTTVKTSDKDTTKMADIKPVGEKATAVTHDDTPTFKDVTGVTTKDRDGSDVITRYKDMTDATNRDGDMIDITTIDKHVTDVTARYKDVTKMGEATPVHKEMTDVTTTEVSLADVTHVYKDATKVSGVISLEKETTDITPADNDIPEIVEHVTDLTTRYKGATKVITKDDVTDVTVDKDASAVAGGTPVEEDMTKIVKEGHAEKSKRGKKDVKELPKKKESLKMEKTKGSRSSKSEEKEIFKERSSSLKAGDVKESVDAHVVESPRVSEKPNAGAMEFSVKDSKKKKKRKKSSIKETLNTVGDKLVPEDRQMTSSVAVPIPEQVVLEKCKEIPQTQKSSKMARATKEVAEGEIAKAEECQSSFLFERTYPSVDRQVSSEEELQREFSLDPTDDKTDESIYNLLPSETEIDVRTDKESIQEELKGEFTTEEMPGTKAGDTVIDSSLQEKDQTVKEEEKQQVKKASISKTKKPTQETKISVKTSNNLVEKSVPKKSETETRTLLGTKAKCPVSHSETSVASKIKFSANKTNLAEEKKKTDRLQRIITQPPPVEVSVETSAFVEENRGEALLLSSSDEAAKKVLSFHEEATCRENESPKMKVKLTENKKKMRRSPFPYGDGNKSLLSKGIEEFFQSDDGILKTTDTEKSIPCPAKKSPKKTDTVPGSSHSTEAMHSEEVTPKSFEDLVGNLSNKDYQTQTVTTSVSKEEFYRKSQEREEAISSVPSHCSHIIKDVLTETSTTEIDSKTEKEVSPLNIKSGSSESIVSQALSKVSSLISKKSTSVSEDGSPKRKSTGSSSEENTHSSPPLSQKSDSSSSLNSGILTLSKKKQQKNVDSASEKISVKASITDSQEPPVSFKSASSSGEDLSTKNISKEVSSSESVLGLTGKKEKLEVPKIAKNVVEKISSLVTSITKQVTESIEELSTHKKKKLKQSSLSKNETNKKQEAKQETQKQKLGSKEKTTKNASELRNRSKGIFAGSQLLSIQQSSRKTSSPAVSRKKGQKQQLQSSSRRDRQNIPLGTITIESPRWEHTYLPLINHLTEEEAAFSDTTPQIKRKKKKKKRKERNLSQLSTATESSCEIDTALLADSHRRSTQDLSVRKKTRATPPRITISENRTSKSDCWQSSTTNLTDEVRREATPIQYLSSDNLSHTRSRSRSHRSPAKELLWLSEQDFLSDSHETDTSRRARSQSHINRFSKINLAYIPTGTRKRKRRKKNIIAV